MQKKRVNESQSMGMHNIYIISLLLCFAHSLILLLKNMPIIVLIVVTLLQSPGTVKELQRDHRKDKVYTVHHGNKGWI